MSPVPCALPQAAQAQGGADREGHRGQHDGEAEAGPTPRLRGLDRARGEEDEDRALGQAEHQGGPVEQEQGAKRGRPAQRMEEHGVARRRPHQRHGQEHRHGQPGGSQERVEHQGAGDEDAWVHVLAGSTARRLRQCRDNPIAIGDMIR